jgi:hypothetical protein
MKHLGKVVNNTDVATKEYVDSLASGYATMNDLSTAVQAKAIEATNNYRNQLDEIYKTVATLDVMYPIGAVYPSMSSTFDPNTSFTGTTWVQLEDWISLTQKADTTKGGIVYFWQRTA